MEANELKVLSNTISGSIGKPLGEFKIAASDSHKNLSKIVKDISSMFATQKRDIKGLAEMVQESVDASTQHASKADQTNNLLSESISIQNSIAAEMKTMSVGIRNLTNAIYWMSGSNTSSIFGNIANSLLPTSLKDVFSGALKMAGIAAGAGVVGAGISSYMNTKSGYKDPNEFYNSIMQAEGTAKTGDPYNTSLGYVKPPKPLTEMTMDESLAWGDYIRTQTPTGIKTNSSAKGAFQIVNTTQRDAMKALGLSGSDKFDEENQKKMASWIARKQGLGAWEGLKTHSQEMETAQRALNAGMDRQTAPQGSSQNKADQLLASGQYTGGFGSGAGSLGAATEPSGKTEIKGQSAEKVTGLQPGIMQKFNEINSAAGGGLTISSGFRSPAENKRVGGASHSAHMRGNAVDVNFPGDVQKTLKLIETASKAGIGGIGVYRPGVLHFDTENRRAWGPDYTSSSIPNWARGAIASHLSGQWGQYDASAQGSPIPGLASPTASAESGGGESGGTMQQQAAAPQSLFEQQIGAAQSKLENIGKMALEGGSGAMPGQTSFPAMSMMNMISSAGMLGSMGGINNLGGYGGVAHMVQSFIPMLSGLIGSLSPTGAQPGEMVVSESEINKSRYLEQAEVDRNVEDYNSRVEMAKNLSKKEEIDKETTVRLQQDGQQSRVDYNNDTDVSVTSEWAKMLGHIGYPEMSNIKLFG